MTARPLTKPNAPADAGSLYKSRWERSFSVPFSEVTRLEGLVAEHLKPDPSKKNPGKVETAYVRALDDEVTDEKFRIRRYNNSGPSFVEFKDTKKVGGKKIKEKTNFVTGGPVVDRLVAGEKAADIFAKAATGKNAAVAQRAIKAVDELGIRPVMLGTYERDTFQDKKTGIRVTFDQKITHTGIGALDGAGSIKRDSAIMDVKVTGETPRWLSSIIDAETGAGNITLLEDGKGSTAMKELAKRLNTDTP